MLQHLPRPCAHLNSRIPKQLSTSSFCCDPGPPAASPIPVSPPACLPGILRLVTQQGKLKSPKVATQTPVLEQPAGKTYGFIWARWLVLFSLLSPSVWWSGTCHSRPQDVPLVRTRVPPDIRMCHTHVCAHAHTALGPRISALDRQEGLASIPDGTRQVCPHLVLSALGFEGSGPTLRAPRGCMGGGRMEGSLRQAGGASLTWGNLCIRWVQMGSWVV